MGIGVYDEKGAAYAEHSARNPWNDLYDRPTILALAGDVAGKRVLDVGCAAGHLTGALTQRGASVVGVDSSSVLLSIARSKWPAEFVWADLAEPLDFPDGSFDVVTASLVLHYLPDWSTPLASLHRVLRPGGVLVMSVHHPCEDWRWFDLPNYFSTELVTDEWVVAGERMVVQYYHRPLSSVFASLREAGFVVHDMVEPMPLPECEQVDPRTYESLTTKPRFLYFKAVAG
ncbi:class I SAM-dependent methyltransferase [Lentzea sp. NBRC 105346]|uniref:class I SAM-dependent methyltransferase n=1 Tax=Lentzea sp. NBRC 105346 TaxID=3032205 RepID=UPI00255567ED|nr:class I SAM-dependent methyltransferase [Lentzea sp. NBRC 105346]